MREYIFKRILLIFPTLFLIMLINFVIMNMAPGGPIDNIIMNIENGASLGEVSAKTVNKNQINTFDDYIVKKLKHDLGFDKPWYVRFFSMIRKYLVFDFGHSLFKQKSVSSLIGESLPISFSLGLWSTLLIYSTGLFLGIKKAVLNKSQFDKRTTIIIAILDGIPSFILGTLLILFFSSDAFLNILPSKGIVSDNFDKLSWFGKIFDYLSHMILPILSISLTSITGLVFLTKNSFLEELQKPYVLTAYAKGANSKQVLLKHVFQNAILIIIADMPKTLITIVFASSLMVEILFSLDGLGMLTYHATIEKDYPVLFAIIYMMTFLGLIANLISDILYTILDPRINFKKQI